MSRVLPKRRAWRVVTVVAIVVAGALAVPLGSFTIAVTRSNGDPFSVKATEWARGHGFSWLVDRTEHVWYSNHQPAKGGVPKGGIPHVAPPVAAATPAAARASSADRHAPVPLCPASPVRLAVSSALSGEGQWQPVGRAPGVLCFAFVRPDPVHTSVIVGVAWMNMHRLTATLHNGSQLPGGGPWQAGDQIAPADYPRVVAAFNSGFRLGASRGGYYTEGRTVRPLVDGRASLVVRTDGTIDIGMWGRDARPGPTIASVRQNLDLLVDGGRPVPGLAGSSHAWGATLGNTVYSWRSGAGVDAHGNLVYVGGPGLDVQTLADVLARAGAVRAMELDINPDWVSLMAYGGNSPANVFAVKLLANMQRPADRYLHPGTRDFVELDLRG